MTHPTDDELEAMAARLEDRCDSGEIGHQIDAAAMLRARKGGAVRVKPLEWVSTGKNAHFGNGLYNYEVVQVPECSWKWRIFNSVTWYIGLDSEESAKAAAQADYAYRILSALAPAPDAQCCMCGKKGLSTVEGDGGDECQLADGRWTCSNACYCEAVYAPDARQEGWNAGMTDREKVARGVWDTLMSDYTFDEAMTGEEQATHAEAIKWVFDVADAAIRALAEKGPTDAP